MSNFTQKIAEYSRARLILLCSELQQKLAASERAKAEPIAIVGLGCRFPGGVSDAASYWDLLRNGVDAITDVPRDRWDVDGYYDADPNVPGKMYCRKGGFLDRVDGFEPEFFNISPREALSLDPQHRLLLEVVWEALEDAGRDPHSLNGSRTGVFVGIGTDDYAKLQVRDLDAKDVSVYSGIGNAYCYAAGRISHILGLHGPCLPVDTACSSALVAIHLACQSLRERECDAAIAGGVQLILAPFAPIFLSKARALAPDGHAKTFDSRADGFCRGEGCGVIVLKRLSDALAANDRIHAVIRSSAVNHDGHSSAFTVPNGMAQQEVIRTALGRGNVDPLDVEYVEAHGTGTSLGDPIEVRSLAAVYGKAAGRSDEPLVLGSVKTNFGHLEGAAGIAGLLKVVLSLQHGVIPPHLNFEKPNPHIPMAEGPFVIPTECRPWSKPRGARTAAVSSFGLSGTNSHVILSDYVETARQAAVGEAPERPLHLFTLSAKTEPALKELASRYARALDSFNARALPDICFTANAGRAHFNHRLAIVASSTKQLKRTLAAFASAAGDAPRAVALSSRARPKVVFLFSGQGSQYLGMGQELYRTQPSFRAALDRCDEICKGLLGESLLSVMFQKEELLDDTTYQQPALFALEYALACMWRSWGVEPAALMGHSVGEVTAACVAGVFSLEDGLKLIVARARLMGALPREGQMVAVLASEATVRPYIEPHAADASIAAVNGPDSVVLSGRSSAVDAIVAKLRERGIETRPLNVSHAFHSPLMDPMLDAFERVLREVTFNRPALKLISNLTGKLVSDEVTTAEYWRRHVREPVRFAAGVSTLYEQGFRLFLELGPKPVLCGLGKRCVPRDGGAAWLPSLNGEDGWKTVLDSLSSLYLAGASTDWRGFDRDYVRRVVTLPTYAFQRQRYWVELTRPAADPFFILESDARQDPELRSLIDHLLGAWGEDGAQAVNRRMTAPALFFPAPMKSFFFVARKEQSLVLLDYVGPDESFESSLLAVSDVAKANKWTLTMLAPPRWVGALARLGWSTTPIGVWQALPELRTFSLEGGERKRLRSKVNSYQNLGETRVEAYRVGSDPSLDREIVALIDDWVERKGKRAPFVAMLKREIAEGRLDPRYRIYLTYHADRLESVILLSPCGRNRGYLMDLEFYRRDIKSGCLEYGITEIIARLRGEGIDYFSIGSTFGTQLSSHENQNAEVESLLRAFYQQGILNSDTNFEFKKKFGPQVTPSYICRPEPSDISDLPVVLRMLADPEPNPSVDGWNASARRSRRSVASSSSAQHPLLGNKLPLALKDTVFESHLDLAREPLGFLGDHRVFGRTILPATGYLECALSAAAATQTGAGPIALQDVSIQQPLAVSNGESPRLQVALSPSGDGAYFRIASSAAADAAASDVRWTEHASGRVVRAATAPEVSATLDALRARCPQRLPVEGYYEQVREFGLEFGPRFFGLREAFLGEDEALGRVRLPLEIEADAERFQAHPALLDACLHVQSAFLLSRRDDEPAVYLPVGIESIRLLKPLGAEAWSHVRMRAPQSEGMDTLVSDFHIYDAAGQLAAQIEGFLVKRTSREAIDLLMQAQRRDDANVLYEVRWTRTAAEQRDAAPGDGYWLVLNDDAGLGKQALELIRAAGMQAFAAHVGETYDRRADGDYVVDPRCPSHFTELLSELSQRSGALCCGVVQLWSSGAPSSLDEKSLLEAQAVGCGGTLHLLQSIVAGQQNGLATARCPIWLVTRGTQTVLESEQPGQPPAGPAMPWFAALWGLGRSIAQEHPELWGGVIDLDRGSNSVEAEAKALIREVLAPDGEDNLAFRRGERFAARLVASSARPQSPSAKPLSLDSESTHVITGGLGGLGLAVARTLVERGARHLALVSRRGAPNDSARAAIAELESLGAEVAVLTADVASADEVSRLLETIASRMPPLAGIVHAAGALADGTLLQQTFARFEEVMEAKVLGSWNLHRLTEPLPLKYFVCFSSIASLLGTAGQANYAAANAFMDSLAHHRRARGLPGLSIHWGPWAEIGMAARLSDRAAAQRSAHGIGALRPKQALQLFQRFLAEQLELGTSGASHPTTEVGVIAVDWERLLNTALKSLKKGSLLRDLASATATLSAPAERSAILGALLDAGRQERHPLLAAYLADLVASIAKLDPERVDRQMPLTEMGFDSLMALEFRERIERDVEVNIPVVALFRGDSIVDFADYLLGELAKQHPEMANVGGVTGRESAEELLAKLTDLDDQTVDALLKSMTMGDEQTTEGL